MGLVNLAILILAGYSVWRLFAENDPKRRKAYLNTLLGYAVTIALGFWAFRSGLPWLVGLIVLAFLVARSGPFQKAFRDKVSGNARSRTESARMTAERAREILGVSESASQREINDRYRELMRRVHPDQGGSSALATELNEAKRVLLGR
jgi:hypothetical protein